MPSRKLPHPSDYQKDRAIQTFNQITWTDVYEDIPATDLPDGVLAKAINAECHGNAVGPRLGSRLWTKYKFPPMGDCIPK
ncbi:MAG: hypothetical protein KKD77_20930, partial [Gammaproteobacteria bacterium]|nr:hypothetical protein [Gammaproteobacteria bacterium]